MSYVSKFNVLGRTINVKDLEARTDIVNINNNLIKTNKLLLKDRKFIFIGDSYGTELHHGGWINKVISRLNLTPGENVFSSAVGGVGYGTLDRQTFYSLLTDLTATIPEDIKPLITDIIIPGSVNDWSSSERDIITGLGNVETFVKNNFPNATLYLPLIGFAYETSEIEKGVINAYNLYNQIATTAVVINDTFINLLCPAYLEDDATHPTSFGMDLVAINIMSVINKGTGYKRWFTDLNCGFTGLQGGAIYVEGTLTESGFNIKKADYGVGLRFDTSPLTITHGKGTLIAKHTGRKNNNIFMNKAVFPCSVLYETNAGYKDARGILRIERVPNEMNWNMYLSSETINPDSGDYITYNVKGIYLQFDSFLGIGNY